MPEQESQSFVSKIVDLVFSPLLKIVAGLADDKVDGKLLNGDQLAGLYNFRSVGKTHFQALVESSKNKYDNETLTQLVLFAEDTLIEAGVPLQEFPDFNAIANKNKLSMQGKD